MFVIQVVPLKRGIQTDALSYFSSERYETGTLVRIPIRSVEVLGMVVDISEVSTAKTALRAATFSLRKLPNQTEPQSLSPTLIETAHELKQQYATNLGTILYHLLPPEVRSGEMRIPHTHFVLSQGNTVPEVLQANKRERFLTYRSLVRETFAHSGSVLIVVPTSIEADTLRESLCAGIEDRTIVITSTLTKKKLRESYCALEDFSKSKLIIATPTHAIIERHDITTVVVEHARTPYYKDQSRPYLDYRDVLRIHAKYTGRRIIFADLLLRTEEEYARRMGLYEALGDTPKRIELSGKLEVIHTPEKQDGEQAWSLFSPKILELIHETKRKKQHLFMFASRRGLAPVVACRDCGHVFLSPQTGAPYSLVRTIKNGIEERWFVCGSSGHRERALDICTECGSWRLRERGIGIQHVHDELLKIAKDIPITLFDHTSAGTYKKACFLRDTFYTTKGAIMLGTQMAIPYLTIPIDNAVVVNMDALYATPTWRLEEENLALLLSLRETTKDTVYIQTRTKDTDLISHAKHAAVEHFYNDELELRKSFAYPPFMLFVHLTWQGTPELVAEIETEVRHVLAPFAPSIYANPQTQKGPTIRYGLIRIPASTWPDETLVRALRKLSPSIRVVLNPDRIV